MRATFTVPFLPNRTLPRWPDAEGVDQIASAGWAGEVSDDTAEADCVIEAPDAVIDEIEAQSGWLRLPDADY